jgi:hypothetical protein
MNISTNEIAGAIAMEALHDLRVNNFMFPGFPSIEVSDLSEGKFIVTISSGSKNKHNVSFSLTKKEGVTAAKNFKKEKRTGNDIFETVQKSLAELEGIALANR